MAKAELMAQLRATVRDLCAAENLLGGVEGSFGYNAVAAKRDAAEQAYEAAMTRIENELFDAASTLPRDAQGMTKADWDRMYRNEVNP